MTNEVHRLQFRVRYCETDAMGVVHHANYVNWFEMGRIELFREQGGNYRKMEQMGLFFVIADVQIKYRKAAYFDDELTLETVIASPGPVKLIHQYRLLRGETLIAEAKTTLACVDRTGVPQRIPADLAERTQS